VAEHAGVALDTATRAVTRDGREVALTPREYALLEALLEHPGRILSRAQLEERLYGWGEEVESNVVEVHVHSLRRKLGADLIRTVRVRHRSRPTHELAACAPAVRPARRGDRDHSAAAGSSTNALNSERVLRPPVEETAMLLREQAWLRRAARAARAGAALRIRRADRRA
jgi:hypothetical protein